MLDSVRARLTLWYVALLGAMLLIFSAVVYGLLSRALYARVDESLDALVNVAEVSLTHDAAEGQSVEDAALSTVTELSNRQQALAIYNEQLEPLAVRLVDDDIDAGTAARTAHSGAAAALLHRHRTARRRRRDSRGGAASRDSARAHACTWSWPASRSRTCRTSSSRSSAF